MAKEPKEESYRSGEKDKKVESSKKAESKTAQLKEEYKKKKEEKGEESVILMGPAYTEEEDAMQPIADVLPDLFEGDSSQGFYEKLPTEESSEIHHHSEKKSRPTFGRFFLGVVLAFVGLVYLGENLGLFNVININILEFWPLILIALGLSVIFSKGRVRKAIIALVAILIVGVVASIVLGGIGIVGQLSGNIVEEERIAVPFTSIALLGGGELIIEQGVEESLTVMADENIIANIKTEVLGGELNLGVKRSLASIFIYGKAEPTYVVTVTELDELRVIGSGSVQSDGIVTNRLELSISGSGDIQMNIEADEIISRIFGSGSYTLSGTTVRQIVHINGSGSYGAADLISKEAGVRISGSGEVLINVAEELNAAVAGSGEIRYIGDPVMSEASVQGSGVIEKINNYIGDGLGNFEMLEKLKKIDEVKYPKIEQI